MYHTEPWQKFAASGCYKMVRHTPLPSVPPWDAALSRGTRPLAAPQVYPYFTGRQLGAPLKGEEEHAAGAEGLVQVGVYRCAASDCIPSTSTKYCTPPPCNKPAWPAH